MANRDRSSESRGRVYVTEFGYCSLSTSWAAGGKQGLGGVFLEQAGPDSPQEPNRRIDLPGAFLHRTSSKSVSMKCARAPEERARDVMSTVLIVKDHRDTVELVRLYLRHYGHKVLAAFGAASQEQAANSAIGPVPSLCPPRI